MIPCLRPPFCGDGHGSFHHRHFRYVLWVFVLHSWLPLSLFAEGPASLPAQAGSFPSCTRGVCALTLENAVRLALVRNRTLLDRRLDREAERLALDIEEDRWSPRGSVGTFASRNRDDDRAGASFRTGLRVRSGGEVAFQWDRDLSDDDGTGSRSLSFIQPLLKGAWGEIDGATVRQARLVEEIGILGHRQAMADLVVSVTGAYRALTGSARQAEIAEVSLRRAREQLARTRALIRVGRVAEREAGRSEAAVANRELALVRARNALEAAQFGLIDILELDDAIRIRPLEKLEAMPRQTTCCGSSTFRGPDTFREAFADALGSRTDYLQAVLQVEIARIDLVVARNGMLPDLALRLEWNRDGNGRADTLVRMDATIPLNDRAPALRRLRAYHALHKAERNVVELRETIGIELRKALNDVRVGYRLTELARDARSLAEDNLAVAQVKFDQGLSSTFEVASSELDLVDAEQAEADATVSWLDALTRLDHLSGQTLSRWGIRSEPLPEPGMESIPEPGR